MTTAYPLAWPIGWPRTPADKRHYGRYSSRDARGWAKDISVAQAVRRILGELDKFTKPGQVYRVSVDDAVISTNLESRKSDGLPKSDQRRPDDPGVAVYFELDGKPRCIPCDAYTTVEQNLTAVAATLSALRTLERHGSGIMERAFTGFEALPHLAEDPWWIVLGVPENAPWNVIELQAKKLRSANHPDRGGDPSQFDRIQKAYDAAKAARS